jgi:hypothetical protein
MKTTRFAIVPGDSREEAIEAAHEAFLELCPTASDAYGGSVPIFDRYILYDDIPEGDSGVWQTDSEQTVEMMQNQRDGMLDRLEELNDDSDIFSPGTAARHRKYVIYDADARPVLSLPHFSKLIQSDDNWVVAARFSY